MPDIPATTPAIAPPSAPECDWADELATIILEQISVIPDGRELLALHLRVLHQHGRVCGMEAFRVPA